MISWTTSSRRVKVTVHEKYSENAAILSGDVPFTVAYQALEHAPQDKIPALFKLLNTTSMEVCEGQQLDLDYETQDDVTEEMYLEMIRFKTSVYLRFMCNGCYKCWRVTRGLTLV